MSLKEKTIRIKEWCKDHKKEIIITVVGVAGCGAVCYGAKGVIGMVSAAYEKSLAEQCDQSWKEYEAEMFVNGIRKQFLNASMDDDVSVINDSMGKLRDIIQREDAFTALQHNDKILCMVQGVTSERGGNVIEAVTDSFPGIDDLQIWVGGTIKE